MKLGWQALVGVTVGIGAALLLQQLLWPNAKPAGAMLPDCGGAMQGVVIQYTQGAADALSVHKQFLAVLPADVHVVAICSNQAAVDELAAALPAEQFRRLDIACVDHMLTPWSRDRWFAETSPIRTSGPVTIVTPSAEVAAAAWPARAGDALLAGDLQRLRPQLFRARRSGLTFDAGDFLADGAHVFVSPNVLARNLHHTARSREQLIAQLAHELGRKPVLLDQGPMHHVGMYMMNAGDKRMLVGDPSLAQQLLGDARPACMTNLPGGPNFSEAMQKQFDSVAAAATNSGYAVTRIPCVPSHDKPYLTYVNVLLDERAGQRTVYMPVFDGLDALNAGATDVWQNLGWRVVPINCTRVYLDGGTLHCLVNVYKRG